ncbi:HalOD1 output domain-containing protein [Natronorubrum daqingense]|uniref:Halobacterial output domain-containing protein n=1 Tax=Natronorubrum daqingense TaxID=588898 RepID=A0A1N7FI09_9EURY|nr:HalOD1 output domain-containing protein [Natronorubrum daqingense]APX98460.1 hypothetical protein BB347_17300 [Natronorubrum daqingense]SIR99927.1 hypothetical protein SAMN05421809_3248 [Natronorubrum daqingense]
MTSSNLTLPDSAPVSQRVVSAVADATDTDPCELEPIFNAINPESLDSLFEPTNGGASRANGTIAFEYAGCDVTVSADGAIDVSVRTPRTTPQAESISTD